MNQGQQGQVCVSVCGKTVDDVISKMDSAAGLADVIEIRFDCLHPDQIEPLVDKLVDDDRRLLITFRPEQQGGRRRLTRAERIAFWDLISTRLIRTEPLIDLELDADFPINMATDRVIVSAHHFKERPGDLSDVFEDLLLFPNGSFPGIVKLAVSVKDASDAVDVWKLLDYFGRPAVPIAMGEAGKWTRILGLAHFAPLTYASLDSTDAIAPGQISAEDLRDVFRVKELDIRTVVYAVVAGDTSYSVSPYMHNAAFKRRGLNSVFVPMQVADLDAFMRRMVKGATREIELNFKGFSVTNPHKQSIIKHLDSIDETARKIGAVNTVKIDGGKLRGFNTDAHGFIEPLKTIYGDLKDAKVTVIGAGGAARACVYALKEEGSEVSIMVRDPAKASDLASEFNLPTHQLKQNDRPPVTDILVNATPLGTKGDCENETVFTGDELGGINLVYDLVYNPGETRLIREARAAGVRTLGGMDMLIAQGARQFKIWTGGDAPLDEMRAAVLKRLG